MGGSGRRLRRHRRLNLALARVSTILFEIWVAWAARKTIGPESGKFMKQIWGPGGLPIETLAGAKPELSLNMLGLLHCRSRGITGAERGESRFEDMCGLCQVLKLSNLTRAGADELRCRVS